MIILDNHRRSAACYHQHGTAVAYGFVIQVDAYDGVAAQGCGTVGHLSEGSILGLAEGAFVRTASAADYITDTGKEILYKVGTDDGFAGHKAPLSGEHRGDGAAGRDPDLPLDFLHITNP